MQLMATIDDYLTRLRDLAGQANHIEHFYLFMTDGQFADWEQDIADSDARTAFYDALLEQYRAWKDAMTPEEWAEVVAYNEMRNGANQNALIAEL